MQNYHAMQISKRMGKEMTPSQALAIRGQSSRKSTLCPRFFILLGFMEGKIRKTFSCWGYLESRPRSEQRLDLVASRGPLPPKVF